jgi:hypothetical protein
MRINLYFQWNRMSNPIPPYENTTATREHWLPLVEQCAKERTTKRLPSLESELGPGRYKLKSDKLLCLPDGTMRYRLHWRGDTGRHTVIGTFDSVRMARRAQKKKRVDDEVGALVLGVDELGRKIIRISAGPNSSVFVPVAVEWELVRGKRMPKPCYDKVAQVFQV